MKKINSSEQILRDVRQVTFRVDTLINEIKFNISKTNQEIADREKFKSTKKE